jgi:DedD protein
LSSPLQNRLVGTIVLAALAVIFLPDLLDGKKESYQDKFVDVPPLTDIEKVGQLSDFPKQEVLEKTQRKITVEENLVVQDDDIITDVSDSIISSPEGTETSQIAEQGATEVNDSTLNNEKQVSWAIQIGVFRNKENVQELLQTLKDSNYRAFERPVQTESGELTKVLVGPELNKNKLNDMLAPLSEVTGLKGKIVPFTML